jgi:hypothetical protein
MWGDPPKPNVWQIKHTPAIPARKKSESWVIQSPLLLTSFTVYKRKQTGRFVVYYGEGLNTGKVSGNNGDWYLEYILSNEWYMEYIKPLIESGYIRKRDDNLKIASEMKDAEVMWGDPPKPNAWKVFFEDGYGARNDRWRVVSPLIVGRILIVEDGPYFRFSYVVSLKNYVTMFSVPKNKVKGNTLGKALFSHAMWEKIRPYVTDGTIVLNVPKIASEQLPGNLEAHWGTPAKKNIWKVRNIFNNPDMVEVTSPFMEGAIEVHTNQGYSNGIYYPDLNSIEGKVALWKIERGDLSYVLSSEGYKNLIKKHIDMGVIKIKRGSKVASSEIKLQWGDPPKPNMWKAERIKGSTQSRLTYLITSPLFRRTIDGDRFALKVQIDPWANEAIINLFYQYNARTGMPLGTYQLSEDYFHNIDHLLAHSSTWALAIKPALARAEREWSQSILTSKVASTAVKLQWGDPPKPNMWKVRRYLGQNNFIITSPLFSDVYNYGGDVTALRVSISRSTNPNRGTFIPKASFSFGLLEENGNFINKVSGGEKFDKDFELEVVNNRVLLNSEEVLKSHSFWKNAVKPALENISTGWSYGEVFKSRVASLRTNWFPDHVTSNPQVKLNWGSPAKPNIWKAWRGDSGDSFFYYIESPLLKDTCIEIRVDQRSTVAEVFFYDDNDGDMRKVKHISLASRGTDPFELDEDVRSEEFWNFVVSPQLKGHGHLNNVRIASEF